MHSTTAAARRQRRRRRQLTEAEVGAAAASGDNATEEEEEEAEEAGFLREATASIHAGLASLSVSALDGTVTGESYLLEAGSVRQLSSRCDAATLAGTHLTAGGGGATFTLPAAAVAAAAEQGAEVSVDVAVSAFAVDPYGWHPSSAAAASAPSELTLRSGGRELSMTNLTAPVLIGLPMAIPLDFDDRNPYTGARCGGPTRADCLLQLSRRNASYDAAVTHVGPLHMGSLPGRHRRWRQPGHTLAGYHPQVRQRRGAVQGARVVLHVHLRTGRGKCVS